jgi:excisionase family DNA binding protein
MHNLVLSPIDPEFLINSISEKVTASILKAVTNEKLQIEQSEQLLTVQQTAEFLSLSVPTIYGLIHKGELPVMKRSKRCYFSKIELIAYLKKGRKKTSSETASEAEQYCKTKKG